MAYILQHTAEEIDHKLSLIDENKNPSDMEDEVDRITRLDVNKEYSNTKSYWVKYVKSHR